MVSASLGVGDQRWLGRRATQSQSCFVRMAPWALPTPGRAVLGLQQHERHSNTNYRTGQPGTGISVPHLHCYFPQSSGRQVIERSCVLLLSPSPKAPRLTLAGPPKGRHLCGTRGMSFRASRRRGRGPRHLHQREGASCRVPYHLDCNTACQGDAGCCTIEQMRSPMGI